MRQNRLLIPLLVVVLVAVSAGVWYLLHGSGGGTRHTDDFDNRTQTAQNDSRPLENGVPVVPDQPDQPDTPGTPDAPDQPETPDQPQPPVNQGEPSSVEAPKTVDQPYAVKVRGRVTIKSDGRAAVGASVLAVTDDQAVTLTGSAVTDSAGEYTMHIEAVVRVAAGESLRAPRVHVTASMPGYAVARSGPVRMGRGSEEQVINLALAPPAAVKGRVVDGVTRDGIAGAIGTFQDVDSMRDGGSSEYAFTTDSTGHFLINNIPAGSYFMSLTAAGYGNFNGWTNPGRIVVPAGVTTDIGEVAMNRFAALSGRVVDPEGKPVENARVSLSGGPAMGAWIGRSTTTTDAEGRFEIEQLEPGQYTLRAQLAGFAPGELAGVAEAGKTVDVGDIVLLKGSELRGHVRDSAGNGIAGAKVSFEVVSSGAAFMMAESNRSTTTTDDQGRFELKGVPSADGYLRAEAAGYAPARLELKVSADMDGIVITMNRGGTVTGRVLDAAGTPIEWSLVSAVDQESAAYKTLRSQAGMVWGGVAGESDAPRSMTSADGRFEIRNVPAGMYLILTADDDMNIATRDDVAVAEGKVVDIGDLQFEGPGRARITITEEGKPVPELKVSMGRFMGWAAGASEAITDSSGVAAFEDMAPGTWYVWTARDEMVFDTESVGRRVAVRSGQTAELTIELRPRDGVMLSGRLTLNGKAVFTEVMLIGTGDRAGIMKNARLMDGGYYELNNIKTGQYVLHARQGDTRITSKVSLNLDKEGDHPFDYDFVGFRMAGSVTTPEDSPTQRGAVQLDLRHATPESRESGMWLRGRSNAGPDGAFEFQDVGPGRYVLTATLAGVGSVEVPVDVQADVTGLKLEISANAGSLKLTVAKLHGTPVSGGSFGLLGLKRADGTDVPIPGESQGFFMVAEKANHTLTTLPPGTYRLEVRASGYVSTFVEAVKIEAGETTQVEFSLTAATELHVTFTNEGLTQELLSSATVHFVDADGALTLVEPSILDMWSPPPVPSVPTVIVKYIGPGVAQVRIKVPGYAEILVPVEFAAGRKITKQESLIAE